MSTYIGSQDIMTSTANEEILQKHKESTWTYFCVYKFSFLNYQDCHIKINDDEDVIFLPAMAGFVVDRKDERLYKFTIIEPDIQYIYIGSFK